MPTTSSRPPGSTGSACLDLGRGERWRARARQIRTAADRAELGVTLFVRLALADIEPDDPELHQIARHNAAALARARQDREAGS